MVGKTRRCYRPNLQTSEVGASTSTRAGRSCARASHVSIFGSGLAAINNMLLGCAVDVALLRRRNVYVLDDAGQVHEKKNRRAAIWEVELSDECASRRVCIVLIY